MTAVANKDSSQLRLFSSLDDWDHHVVWFNSIKGVVRLCLSRQFTNHYTIFFSSFRDRQCSLPWWVVVEAREELTRDCVFFDSFALTSIVIAIALCHSDAHFFNHYCHINLLFSSPHSWHVPSNHVA